MNNIELLGQDVCMYKDADQSCSLEQNQIYTNLERDTSELNEHQNFLNDITRKKVAFITAIYGNYEASCKKYVPQTIPSDFICFTNNDKIISNNWEVDKTPYFINNTSTIDDGSYLNSIKNNNHTFNLAKYFKQSFYNIPRLKEYDVVVWLDGTIEVTNANTTEYILNHLKDSPIITWEHNDRRGSLASETRASHFSRYTDTSWLGQKQPYQDVAAQYKAYIVDGYKESLWKEIEPKRINFGVWITCFIAFDNKNDQVKRFLDFWYLQTLNYTTQDQVGFSYAVSKLSLYPYTLPNGTITGSVWNSALFKKHSHHL